MATTRTHAHASAKADTTEGNGSGAHGKRTFRTHIDLPAKTRSQVVAQLNQTLADTFDLFSQTKQAHWNVKGPEFYHLHLLFDEIAGELSDFVDEVAERLTALGGYALGTARMAASASTLPEYPTDAVDSLDHVRALVERFGLYAAHVREGIDSTDELGDKDTADLYTGISRVIDKRLWFLEAHLQGRCGAEGEDAGA
jgi:starvation-inducible DNA-binding protein